MSVILKFWKQLLGLHPYTFYYGDRGKITFWARNEEKAKRKLRSFIVDIVYGPWALVYDSLMIDELMEAFTLGQSEIND